MGKGDRRTKKGKMFVGSYGKTRFRGLKKKNNPVPVTTTEATPASE